jgi:hypothetical protein
MSNTLRWVLVAPATIAATVGAFIGLTIVWNIVRLLNIVPQGGLIDLAFANAAVNALAAAAGVFAGARLAPRGAATVAVVTATILVLLAIVTLMLGSAFRAQVSMSIGWHVFSSVAWAAGAVGAAVAVHRERERATGSEK